MKDSLISGLIALTSYYCGLFMGHWAEGTKQAREIDALNHQIDSLRIEMSYCADSKAESDSIAEASYTEAMAWQHYRKGLPILPTSTRRTAPTCK